MDRMIFNDKTQNYHLIFYNLFGNAEQPKTYSDNGLTKKSHLLPSMLSDY